MKLVFGERRQDGPFQAHHRADEPVDDHQQRELRSVRTKPESNVAMR